MISIAKCNASMTQVKRAKVFRPERAMNSERWKGVKFGEVLETLINQCQILKWEPKNYRAHMTKDAEDVAIALSLPKCNTCPPELLPEIVLLASNSGTRRNRFYAGAVEKKSGNPIVTAEFLFSKCTSGKARSAEFDLFHEIKRGLQWYATDASVKLTYVVLKQHKLTKEEADHLMVESYRKNILPWEKIRYVDSAYKVLNDQTTWGLLSAYGKAVSMNPAQDQCWQMLAFRDMLMMLVQPKLVTA